MTNRKFGKPEQKSHNTNNCELGGGGGGGRGLE